jgi:replicative DNA helicase
MSTPTNTDAERSILGTILLDNHAYLETSQGIAVEDFSLDSHRRIYSRMVQLMESNRPVDMVTLIDELNIHKDLEKIGDVAYIASLVQGVPERSSIQHYIDIVRDKAQQRSLATLCTTILSRIDQQNEKALPIMAAMEESLAVIAGKPRNEALSLRQLLPMVLNDMARERERQSEYIGIPTGIRDLDEALGGIREGELVIAGAMPGRGKTSFGVQFGINAVRENFPTIDFSLEMKNWQVGRRIIAGYTPASAFGARDAKMLSEARWQQVIESASQLAQLPLYVDDSSSISLREMRSRIKLYKKKFGL